MLQRERHPACIKHRNPLWRSQNLLAFALLFLLLAAAPGASQAAQWTEWLVDDSRDGEGCAAAFSPVTQMPSVAYTGRDPDGSYRLYYAEMQSNHAALPVAEKWAISQPLANLTYGGRETSLAYNPQTNQPGIAFRTEFGQISYLERNSNGLWDSTVVDIGGDNSNGVSLAFSPTTGKRAIGWHKAWGQDVIVHWYDPARGGWVRDVAGAGIWDFAVPSVGFSTEGVPAVSYYDGAWGLSSSLYDPASKTWVAEPIPNAGGGRSSIAFDPSSAEPVVASIGYNIGSSGQVQLSFRANGQWTTINTGMYGNDDLDVGVSLAFDDQGRPRIAFDSGDITLMARMDSLAPEAQWNFESVMLHAGVDRPYLAIDGHLIGVAVSSPDGLRFAMIPEPATILLVGLGGFTIILRRCRAPRLNRLGQDYLQKG